MNDKQLRQHILDELDFDPCVKATNIGVAVEDGVVSLSGHVGSYREKVATQRAVRRLQGVRAVVQNLEVRFDNSISDDQIAKRVVDVLRWSSLPDTIKVTVQHGWVTLNGEVDWQYQKKAAEDGVHRLAGIAGLINSITIRPRTPIRDVAQKIENALKRSAEIEAKGIRITLRDGGTIVLEGDVHDWQERNAVETAAWSVPGIVGVDNKLTIMLSPAARARLTNPAA